MLPLGHKLQNPEVAPIITSSATDYLRATQMFSEAIATTDQVCKFFNDLDRFFFRNPPSEYICAKKRAIRRNYC
jgi:hypothetical protein